MKLYVKRNECNSVHGVDYHKGLESGESCGVAHEFMTRNCQPVIFTEGEIPGWHHGGDFVEVRLFNDNLGQLTVKPPPPPESNTPKKKSFWERLKSAIIWGN